MKALSTYPALGTALLLLSCTDPYSGASGRVVLRARGGNEARDGIKAAQFADGYAVEYEHALLSVSQFHLRTTDGEDANLEYSPAVVDLIPTPVTLFEADGVPAQRWDEVGFSSHPPDEKTRNVNAPEALFELMIEKSYSFLQTGVLISPEGERSPFELGFPVRIDYFSCTAGDGKFGIVVPVNGEAETEVTWHLTHLFFDSFAEDSAYRAEAMAAVYDGEQPVRTEDREEQPLGSLVGADGAPLRDQNGNPVIYIPPQDPGVRSLRDFVLRSRFGHFNGLSGSCNTEIEVLDESSGARDALTFRRVVQP